MANAPLKLDWKELLPGRDDAPPPEVEVIAAASGDGGRDAAAGDSFVVEELSDHQLQEKIQQLSNEIASGITNRHLDLGVKLLFLQQLQNELARREVAKNHKSDREYDRTTSEVLKSSYPFDDSTQNASSSLSCSNFALHFSKFQEKSDAAFSEELRCISGYKYKTLKEFGQQMCNRPQLQISSQPATMWSRELPSHQDKGFRIAGCRNVGSSSISSSNTRSKICTRFSKRRRASKGRGSPDWEFEKVKDVVLLDDEDIQPMETIEDVPDEWKESKIYYPSREAAESVEISYSDITCLDPKSYLSSTIMNFYIQYLQRSLSFIGRSRDNYIIFNTYFYKKLEEAVSCKIDRTANFLKLRRWWKGVDIFQKAYILLPVHGDLHWSLVIICIPAKEDDSGPIILHMDSLRLHSSCLIFDTVDSYLTEEWNYINNNVLPQELPISEEIWKHLPHRIEKKRIMVPQQKNKYDCGLFVLYFMERFISEAPDKLGKKDLNNVSMFGRAWFKSEEASSLRSRIRNLLMEEFKNNRVEESPISTDSSENKK